MNEIEPVLEAVELWLIALIRLAIGPSLTDPDRLQQELRLAKANLLEKIEMLNGGPSSSPPST